MWYHGMEKEGLMPSKSLEDATSVIPEIIAGQLTRDVDEIKYLVGRSHVAWDACVRAATSHNQSYHGGNGIVPLHMLT